MTISGPKDKISAVIAGETDQAVFPMVCADHCAWLARTPFADIAADGDRLAAVIMEAYRRYDYDMVLVFTDPYVEAQALGCAVEFSPHLKLLGPSARLVEAIAPVKPVRAGRAHASCGIDRTAAVVRAAGILEEKAEVPVFASVKGPFSLAAFIASAEHFFKLLITNGDKAFKFIDTALDFQKKYIARLAAAGANIFIGDPMASASIVSPRLFETYAAGPLRDLVKTVKDQGRLCGIHVCGDTLPIMPLLDRLGADILSVEDITPVTKTLKMGGVSTNTIFQGALETIQREIAEAARIDRLIFSTSCDVPVATPPENVAAMIEAARDIISGVNPSGVNP